MIGTSQTRASPAAAKVVRNACANIVMVLCGSAAGVSCAATRSEGAAAESPRAEAALEASAAHATAAASDAPFTETIAGTALAIEMLPLRDGAPDAPPVWMSATEITWDLYDAFVFGLDEHGSEADRAADALARPSKPYILMDRGFGHAGYPVISVNHTGAAAFCAWLTHKTGRPHRLPTEAEWERGCRAGSSGAWCTDDDAASLADYAWFKDNAERKTHPVRSKAPNAWGFFDMHGNAAEWCTSAHEDPVVRGGSYRDSAQGLRADARVVAQKAWNASDPQLPRSKWWLADGGFIGFRIVCEGPSASAQIPRPSS